MTSEDKPKVSDMLALIRDGKTDDFMRHVAEKLYPRPWPHSYTIRVFNQVFCERCHKDPDPSVSCVAPSPLKGSPADVAEMLLATVRSADKNHVSFVTALEDVSPHNNLCEAAYWWIENGNAELCIAVCMVALGHWRAE